MDARDAGPGHGRGTGEHAYGTAPGRPPHPARPVPRPAAPPPIPAQAPPVSATEAWLRTPRISDAPGIYAYGHVPRDPDRVPDGRVLGRALLGLVAGIFVWSLRNNGFLPWWQFPLHILTPHSWSFSGHLTRPEVFTQNLYSVLSAAVMVWLFGRLGAWPEAARRFLDTRARRGWFALAVGVLVWQLSWTGYVPILDTVLDLFPYSWISGGGNADRAAAVTYTIYAAVAALIAYPCAKYGGWFGLTDWDGEQAKDAAPRPKVQAPDPLAPTPADWPELRAAGRSDAADRLAREVSAGKMNDVDCVRIRQAWNRTRQRPREVLAFTDQVRRLGGGACLHPSGDRDLAHRTAPHDLLGGQVRIGRGAEDERNSFAYRGSGMALEPALLGTGLLVVGPPGADRTRHVLRPVAESLCLQALTGGAAVIVVADADTDLGPDEAYDVVIAPGDPDSRYSLDLYGGGTDPDRAALLLAEALVDGPEAEQRRAAAALGQLLGPYAAAHGRFPTVPVLRELLDGAPEVYEELSRAVTAAGRDDLLRELDARLRQSARPGDIGSDLANRIAVLDRPAFAASFGDPAPGGTEPPRPFSMEALVHPVRVRVELPERGHPAASRILVRLLVAQFTAAVRDRRAGARFAGLVVDDIGQAVTAGTVRALAALPTTRAGMALGLRTLDDVPEPLRGPLVAAAGCRMALAGISAWDGRFFAETWGTTRVESREVTSVDQSGTMAQRASRVARRMITGRVVAADAVTVREVERERWSASDLAHTVPAGHAVLSLTTTGGNSAPPVLVDLRG
ncbi:hypothetical protein SAMN05216251_12143 [Actinacidiphila alni]|uniref:ATP/GTP-binding protein n=1 Tax=Actinacidiphila alni TaxID=380248 RepID=A0A1I2K798_9ACTN|nr:hypothetical protein [Actinacidiphila alni]SFF61067.1 hypothetical protein SAMN05216251_12143 [Actinacidiphila alni]